MGQTLANRMGGMARFGHHEDTEIEIFQPFKAHPNMKMVNVDNAESTNAYLDEQVQTTLANYREADVVKAISDMNLVENSFQAAVNTTSRVIQGTSLLDFLR